MTPSTHVSRREFIQTVAVGVTGTALLPSTWAEEPRRGPNDRINLGFIGVGTMGRGHVSAFVNNPGVQVVAICDVVKERREHCQKTVEDAYAKQKDKGSFKDCKVYNDFRELLARKDIDAVVIATPDHWHAIPCVQAIQAGKDVYCEKPLTHNIAEGRAIVDAAAKHKIIFQTGSQQRSEFGGRFRLAVELVRNGRIGQLKTVRIGVGGPNKPCDLPEQPVPEGTDWDLWLGPAPKRAYNEILCPKGIHKHFPAWRAYREYAGGGLADMGAHHFDIAQWAMNMDHSGPVKIEPPEKGDKGLKFIYASGVEMTHGGEADCVFVGTEGTILVSRGKIESKPDDIVKVPIGEKDFHVYPSTNHRQNWLDCVRSRKEPICPAEVGHRSATICHLGNIGYQLRKPLRWDPAKERFDDDAANQLVARVMREPWKL